MSYEFLLVENDRRRRKNKTQIYCTYQHEKPRFLEKVFIGYNYDPEIHEEYLIHDTPFFLPHHL